MVHKVKGWTYGEVKRYLDEVRAEHKYTFAYFKALSQVEGKVTREKLLEEMSRILGESVTGYQLADVQAGITMTVVKKLEKERLDGKDRWGRHFWLNDKYAGLVKRYFAEEAA